MYMSHNASPWCCSGALEYCCCSLRVSLPLYTEFYSDSILDAFSCYKGTQQDWLLSKYVQDHTVFMTTVFLKLGEEIILVCRICWMAFKGLRNTGSCLILRRTGGPLSSRLMSSTAPPPLSGANLTYSFKFLHANHFYISG